MYSNHLVNGGRARIVYQSQLPLNMIDRLPYFHMYNQINNLNLLEHLHNQGFVLGVGINLKELNPTTFIDLQNHPAKFYNNVSFITNTNVNLI